MFNDQYNLSHRGFIQISGLTSPVYVRSHFLYNILISVQP